MTELREPIDNGKLTKNIESFIRYIEMRLLVQIMPVLRFNDGKEINDSRPFVVENRKG